MDLFVFHRDLPMDKATLDGGVKGVVLDFEKRGKTERQNGFDTQINDHRWNELREVKQDLQCYVICRINGTSDHTKDEVAKTLDFGADEILIPMVRQTSEVISILKMARDKARVSAMIETTDAINISHQLDQLQLARVYVGLNDLRICRGSNSIFTAMADGTLESIREKIKQTPFGFGGLTIPGFGAPLPVELFLNEMTRMACQFTFLRRSFFRDTAGKNVQLALRSMFSAIQVSMNSSQTNIHLNQTKLRNQLDRIVASST